MASINSSQCKQAKKPISVFPITGGSALEPATKKQKKDFERRVSHIGVQGPHVRTIWSHVSIVFTQDDFRLRDYPHNGAMVINCAIGGYIIHNVLVDNGSAADILTAKAFEKMGLAQQDLQPSDSPLCGFGGNKFEALGKIKQTVCFGEGKNTRAEEATFDVVDIDYPYNAIIGRPTLNAFEAVVHSAYLVMKIPSRYNVITVFGSQEEARKKQKKAGHHNASE